MFIKIHHAVVDGMAAVHLMRELHASTPAADGLPSSAATIVTDRTPMTIELLARSLDGVAEKAGRAVRLAAKIGARLLVASGEQWPQLARGDFKAVGDEVKLVPAAAPTTRFSAQVSRHRVMEAFGMPLSRVARIRSKLPGVTINDVFVAVAGGATRGATPGSKANCLRSRCRD